MKKRFLFILSLMTFFLVGYQSEASAKIPPVEVEFEFRLYTDIKNVDDMDARGDFVSATTTMDIEFLEYWLNSQVIFDKVKTHAEKALSDATGKSVLVNSLIRGKSSYPYSRELVFAETNYGEVTNGDSYYDIQLLFPWDEPDTKVIINLFGSLNGPLNGWHVYNGAELYYENNVYKTGVQKVGNTTYFFNYSGRKLYGWHIIDGGSVYFNEENGGLWTGKRTIGKTTYLFNSQGHKVYGWHRLNGKDYYFNQDNGGMWTGKRLIGRTTYLLHNDGHKIPGWFVDENGRKYYFDPNFGGGMVTGLRKVGNAYYYFDVDNGHAYTDKTMNVNKQVWYFDNNGVGRILK